MPKEITLKIEEYFSQYNRRTYKKDQILIHAGDEPQHIYYLISGKVRQYDITYRGDEIILNIMKPGAFFPMQLALTKIPNKYFFVAETDIEVRVAPIDASVAFLKDNPDVMLDLLTRVYRGVDGLLGRMVELMSGSAQSRLIYELIVECRRFGEWAEDGSCFIAVNESDLAARAGLSRETVSREMQKIGKNGLIHISHSGILIKEPNELGKRLINS